MKEHNKNAGKTAPTFAKAAANPAPLPLKNSVSASFRTVPCARDSLTGKINQGTMFGSSDLRSRIPRFTPEARKTNQALVDLLAALAERKKATPAQIALAWLLAQKPWIVPIRGTTKLARVEENIGAAAIDLTRDDLREIQSAPSKIIVQGARYSEELERMTYRWGVGRCACQASRVAHCS